MSSWSVVVMSAAGVSWLRAEDGIPRRIKAAAYLTDEEILHLAAWAAQARAIHLADDHSDSGAKVITLGRNGRVARGNLTPGLPQNGT